MLRGHGRPGTCANPSCSAVQPALGSGTGTAWICHTGVLALHRNAAISGVRHSSSADAAPHNSCSPSESPGRCPRLAGRGPPYFASAVRVVLGCWPSPPQSWLHFDRCWLHANPGGIISSLGHTAHLHDKGIAVLEDVTTWSCHHPAHCYGNEQGGAQVGGSSRVGGNRCRQAPGMGGELTRCGRAHGRPPPMGREAAQHRVQILSTAEHP